MKADKPLGSIVINLELYYNTEEPLTLLIFLSKFKHIVRTRSFFFAAPIGKEAWRAYCKFAN